MCVSQQAFVPEQVFVPQQAFVPEQVMNIVGPVMHNPLLNMSSESGYAEENINVDGEPWGNINPQFLKRLTTFEGFLTSNAAIWHDQFQLFRMYEHELAHIFPILGPLANDFLTCFDRLQFNHMVNNHTISQQIYDAQQHRIHDHDDDDHVNDIFYSDDEDLDNNDDHCDDQDDYNNRDDNNFESDN